MRNRTKSILALGLTIALPALALIAYTYYKGVGVGAQQFVTDIPALATSTDAVSTSTVIISNPVQQAAPTPASTSVPQHTTTTTGVAPSQTPTSPQQSQSPSGWYYVFVAPDDYHKNPGRMISFTGNHFYPHELVTITQSGTRIGSVQANAAGVLKTNSFVVPYTAGNVKYVFSGNVSQIPFTVNVKVGNENPWITLSTYYAGSGQPVTIAGHSFGSYEQVTIWFGDTNLGTVSTNADGEFSLNAVVPAGNTGQTTVRAVATRTHSSASQGFSQAF